jgi:hypothetical protein
MRWIVLAALVAATAGASAMRLDPRLRSTMVEDRRGQRHTINVMGHTGVMDQGRMVPLAVNAFYLETPRYWQGVPYPLAFTYNQAAGVRTHDDNGNPAIDAHVPLAMK